MVKTVWWRGWREELKPRTFFSLHDWLFFLVAWPIMLEGLEVAAMILHPITPLPLLRDRPWDWLDPWKIWCPNLGPRTTDFSHDYCYGTNVAHFGGPYSLLWYWLMYVLALGGNYYPTVNNLTVFVLINFLIVWRMRRTFTGYNRYALMNVFYSWTAFMFLLAWPQILLTLFFSAASLLTRRRWLRVLLLTIGPLLRFPLGGPLYLWTFITHFSFHVWGNAPPYALTIIFWLFCVGFLFLEWKPKRFLNKMFL